MITESAAKRSAPLGPPERDDEGDGLPAMDRPLRRPGARPRGDQIDDVIAFLNTLSDGYAP
jgi:hypothetical protein